MFYDRLVDADDRQCFFEIVKVCAALFSVIMVTKCCQAVGWARRRGRGVTHRGRDTLPVFVTSREWKRFDSGDTDSVPGEGGVHSLIWPGRVCAPGYGFLGRES